MEDEKSQKFIVGAYTASPCSDEWDPKKETEFYNLFKQNPLILGLEYPFYGKVHRFDESWVWKNLNPDWEICLTCIPGTMDELRLNPRFGLASNDLESRLEALEFIHQAFICVNKFKEKNFKVRSIQIQSGPRRISGEESTEKDFENSLEHILKWKWGETQILVEHCDAWAAGKKVVKGFLSLEEEARAIKKALSAHKNKNLGILINWGRSAIESQSVQGPHEHIAFAKKENLLKALIFSGATEDDVHYGQWADTHAPLKELAGNVKCEKSILTTAELKKSMLLAGSVDYVGLKMQPLPKSVSIQDRAIMISEMLKVLASA